MRVCTAVITQPTRCRLPGMRSTVTGWCCTAAAVLWCMAPVVHPPRPWGGVTRGVDRWHRHSVFPMREQPGNCPTTTKQRDHHPTATTQTCTTFLHASQADAGQLLRHTFGKHRGTWRAPWPHPTHTRAHTAASVHHTLTGQAAGSG